MHDTKQGVFLSTPFFKCVALGILSDKLPLGDTVLPPPPHSNLPPDIASRGRFLQPLVKISEFNSDWPILGHVPMPEPITVVSGWNTNKGLRHLGSFPRPLSQHGCFQMGKDEC